MTRNRGECNRGGVAKSGLAVAIVLLAVAMVPSTLAHGAGGSVAPTVALTGGSSVAWAFGGSGFNSSSCTDLTCPGGNLSINGSFSASWKLYVGWVVLYNETNVSSSQKEISTQAAINASLSYSFSSCTVVTIGQPCVSDSATVTLAGKALASGFTNLTNGTVDLLSGPGGTGPTAAWAVTNSSSNEAFNFSGGFSLNVPSSSISGSGGFDLGASEHSSIQFSPSLGLVPQSPQAGETWNASAPFTASGTWAAGYSFNAAISGQPPNSSSSWNHGSVAPSGNLTAFGEDLGSTLLWNNYTNPHTSTSAHDLDLTFSGANFSAMDGWIFGPTDLFTGLLPSFSGAGNFSANASESAFFVPGTGFVGGNLATNGSNLSVVPGLSSFQVTAGPEPVSVAQQQYAAIASGGSGSGGFPILLAVGVVAAAVVAAGAGVLLWRRSARAKPPAPPQGGAPAEAGAPAAAPPSPPTGTPGPGTGPMP